MVGAHSGRTEGRHRSRCADGAVDGRSAGRRRRIANPRIDGNLGALAPVIVVRRVPRRHATRRQSRRWLLRLDVPASRAVAFSGATHNSLVVLPPALALPTGYELAAAAVVAQTLVEMVGMVVYVRAIPGWSAPAVFPRHPVPISAGTRSTRVTPPGLDGRTPDQRTSDDPPAAPRGFLIASPVTHSHAAWRPRLGRPTTSDPTTTTASAASWSAALSTSRSFADLLAAPVRFGGDQPSVPARRPPRPSTPASSRRASARSPPAWASR